MSNRGVDGDGDGVVRIGDKRLRKMTAAAERAAAERAAAEQAAREALRAKMLRKKATRNEIEKYTGRREESRLHAIGLKQAAEARLANEARRVNEARLANEALASVRPPPQMRTRVSIKNRKNYTTATRKLPPPRRNFEDFIKSRISNTTRKQLASYIEIIKKNFARTKIIDRYKNIKKALDSIVNTFGNRENLDHKQLLDAYELTTWKFNESIKIYSKAKTDAEKKFTENNIKNLLSEDLTDIGDQLKELAIMKQNAVLEEISVTVVVNNANNANNAVAVDPGSWPKEFESKITLVDTPFPSGAKARINTFRQKSPIIAYIKQIYGARKLYKKPGRKPAPTNAAATARFNAEVEFYKQGQDEIGALYARYITEAGLKKELATDEVTIAAVANINDITPLLKSKPDFQKLVQILVDCNKQSEDEAYIKKANQTHKAILDAANTPDAIRDRIFDTMSEEVVFYLLQSDSIVPPIGRKLIPILPNDIDLVLSNPANIIYTKVVPDSAIVVKNNLVSYYYNINEAPDIIRDKHPELFDFDKKQKAVPNPRAKQLSKKNPKGGILMRGGRMNTIEGEDGYVYTNTVNSTLTNRPETVEELLKQKGVGYYAVRSPLIRYLRPVPDPIYYSIQGQTIDTLVASHSKFKDSLASVLFEGTVLEKEAISVGDVLQDTFDDVRFPASTSIHSTDEWKTYSAPALPAEYQVAEKWVVPIRVAREQAATGNWTTCETLYKYTKVMKVVDACHDFPNNPFEIIDNVIELNKLNVDPITNFINGKLGDLKVAIGKTASQAKLEEFALSIMRELMNDLEDLPVFFNKFLPQQQQIIASGNLFNSVEGVRVVDTLASIVKKVEGSVLIEATDHLGFWKGNKERGGLMSAILAQNGHIQKACEKLDALDAASGTVTAENYKIACEGVTDCNPVRTAGWPILFTGKDTNQLTLATDEGLLCPSAAESDKIKALLTPDIPQSWNSVPVVLNTGLPNICEILYKEGSDWKVRLFCKINNNYVHVGDHNWQPFSVNSIIGMLEWSGGRGGYTTVSRKGADIVWTEAATSSPNFNIIKTNILIDRKTAGDGRMTTMFGLGITLDKLAAFFFLLFYGITLSVVKGNYELISLFNLPADDKTELWKNFQFLKQDADAKLLTLAIKQYTLVYDILKNVGTKEGQHFNELEPLVFIAASAGFIKLRKNEDGRAFTLDDLKYELREASFEAWPYSNIPGWIENELRMNAAMKMYTDTFKELEKYILEFVELKKIEQAMRGEQQLRIFEKLRVLVVNSLPKLTDKEYAEEIYNILQYAEVFDKKVNIVQISSVKSLAISILNYNYAQTSKQNFADSNVAMPTATATKATKAIDDNNEDNSNNNGEGDVDMTASANMDEETELIAPLDEDPSDSELIKILKIVYGLCIEKETVVVSRAADFGRPPTTATRRGKVPPSVGASSTLSRAQTFKNKIIGFNQKEKANIEIAESAEGNTIKWTGDTPLSFTIVYGEGSFANKIVTLEKGDEYTIPATHDLMISHIRKPTREDITKQAAKATTAATAATAAAAAAAATSSTTAGGRHPSQKSKRSKRNGSHKSLGRLLSRKLSRRNLHRSHRRPRPAAPTAQRRTQRRRKSNK